MPSPDTRSTTPALTLLLGAAVACNANPSDNDGSSSTMMQETTDTGDTDGDGDGETTDGETTDGEPDICNGNVPAFVTPECVTQLWNLIHGLVAQSRGGIPMSCVMRSIRRSSKSHSTAPTPSGPISCRSRG
jgi:hypothetical protein